jgi:CBS domain-containing protein
MGLTARDVMDTCFQTLRPEMSIAETVKVFVRAGRVSGQRIFGIMVKDASGALVGMLSIYDIFRLLRSKDVWGETEVPEVSGLLEAACQQAREVRVGDIMTTELITVTPETNLLQIIDIMIAKHVRRLPVLEGGRIAGIVYISRVFEHLLAKLSG